MHPVAFRLAVAALPLLACVAGCASSGTKSNSSNAPDRPIEELVAATKRPEAIGKFLADVNQAIKAWNNLFLDAQSDAERSRGRLLETHLMTVTHQRRDEIIKELESGPLNNRIVAAAALGFTHDVEAQSPLLAALNDPHEEVIANALFGLWLLGRMDTPIDRICPLFSTRYGDNVRRLIPSSAAAVVLLPLWRESVSRMCRFSTSANGSSPPARLSTIAVSALSTGAGAGPTTLGSGRCSSRISPSLSTTALSMQFSSSRTLPGHR